MNWNYGMGWGSWLIACGMMLAFVALVVLMVVALARGERGFRVGNPRAKDILDERLARGEIDVEEYTRTLDVLRGGEDVHRVG